MTDRFTDLTYVRDADGIYDLAIDDEAADFALTGGLETAVFVSLFSDRRATADEVADPMRRRGWICDLVAEVPDDRHGSGLWLYEQRRLTGEVRAGVRAEVVQALAWMVDENLAKTIDCDIRFDAARRQLFLDVTCTASGGGAFQFAYALWSLTRPGEIARNFN